MICKCGHLDGEHFDEVAACGLCPCTCFRVPGKMVTRPLTSAQTPPRTVSGNSPSNITTIETETENT